MPEPDHPQPPRPMDRTTEIPRAVKVLLVIAGILIGLVILLDLVAILGHL